MTPLSVIRLGAVDGLVMTNAFVALAESVSEGGRGDTLVICHPSAPFANAGFHQEVEREIDTGFCASNNIPVVRRVIGGGAIADGPWEQDYFFISGLDSDATRGTLKEYYGRMLEPLAAVLAGLGVRAERQGLNDLAVSGTGRKISANGAVDIGGARVLTGDILLDLNIHMMSGILRVPDEKFRGKVAESMAQYLTSLREQLGREVPRDRVEELIVREFASMYGDRTVASALTRGEQSRLDELVRERGRQEWVYERSASGSVLNDYMKRVVKIREGMFLCRHDRKAQKLVRATLLVDNGRIAEVGLSGDFFTVPVGWPLTRLEEALKGLELNGAAVSNAVRGVLERDGVTVMGATADDIAGTVMEAARHPIVVRPG